MQCVTESNIENLFILPPIKHVMIFVELKAILMAVSVNCICYLTYSICMCNYLVFDFDTLKQINRSNSILCTDMLL